MNFFQPISDYIKELLGRRPQYVGFWMRIFCCLLDIVIVSFSAIFSYLVLVCLLYAPYYSHFLLSSWMLLWYFFYFSIMESSPLQSSFGKMVMGMKVQDKFGRRISFSRAGFRTFLKFFSILFFFIGYVSIPFTEKKQSIHDLIVDTQVIQA
jgi:uncharacterized RDD family membrane protein YckC